LFLQALLEDEKVLVVLKSSQQNGKLMMQTKVNNGVYHPRYTGGRDTQVMVVSLHTTITEITSKVTGRSLSNTIPSSLHIVIWGYVPISSIFAVLVIYMSLSLPFPDLPLLPGQFLEKASEKSDETKKDNLSNYSEMADYLSSSVGMYSRHNS
jgi:hypothetical protein